MIFLLVHVYFSLGITLHGVGGAHGHSHSLGGGGGGHGHSHDKRPLIENGEHEANQNYGATSDAHTRGKISISCSTVSNKSGQYHKQEQITFILSAITF